jgi:hypothetical protein
MKKLLILIPLLILMSCAIEGPDCTGDGITITANDWPSALDPQIRISYSSYVNGYELYTGCSDGTYPPEWKLLDKNETKNWAEWVIVRECKPEYIRVVNAKAEKVIML